jgi:hypothetical protein
MGRCEDGEYCKHGVMGRGGNRKMGRWEDAWVMGRCKDGKRWGDGKKAGVLRRCEDENRHGMG